MDFLSKNYEKLILAFCLIILVAGITFVSYSFKSTSDSLTAQYKSAQNKVVGGDKLELTGSGEFSAAKYLNDSRKYLNVLGNARKPTLKGSLIEPNKYIVCKNEECMYLLSINADKCPFCGTEQPELAKETLGEEDSDNDGIPDKFENQYAAKGILNPRYPNDAKMDYDRDGFLNVEEYKYGTKLDDPEDFPALGYLLRAVNVVRNNLDLKLAEIDTNKKDDPKQWDVYFTFTDPKTGKSKRSARSIGDKLAGFELLEAGFTGAGDNQTPYAVVVSEKNSSEKYRLEAGKETPSKRLNVRLVYLMSRDRNNYYAVMQRCVLNKEVGDEFALEKYKMTSVVKEFYRILSADEKEGTVKVALLKEEKGSAVKEIEVGKLVPMEDFVSLDAMGGMMGGGAGPMFGGGPGPMGGGPGPMGGAPGEKRNNRRQNR